MSHQPVCTADFRGLRGKRMAMIFQLSAVRSSVRTVCPEQGAVAVPARQD